MTRKTKTTVFIISIVVALLPALAGAAPYGYFLLALGGLSGDTFITTLCWALYVFTAALLWLAIWRMLVLAVRHWPGRR
jgi:hypothetical protein